jgi:signal transduction histidine kinase
MQAIPEDKKGNIFIRAKATHETVTIAVQDNGSGISTAQVEKIFTPYFSTKTVGMGLGLPIVKSMIESGGGHIYFETEEGKGTTFTIELPLQRNA